MRSAVLAAALLLSAVTSAACASTPATNHPTLRAHHEHHRHKHHRSSSRRALQQASPFVVKPFVIKIGSGWVVCKKAVGGACTYTTVRSRASTFESVQAPFSGAPTNQIALAKTTLCLSLSKDKIVLLSCATFAVRAPWWQAWSQQYSAKLQHTSLRSVEKKSVAFFYTGEGKAVGVRDCNPDKQVQCRSAPF